jgi:hypothetical protein
VDANDVGANQPHTIKDYVFEFDDAKAILATQNTDPSVHKKNTKKEHIASRRKGNHDKLEEMVRNIKDATVKNGHIKVILTGHSDERVTRGSAYQSNYELAAARAENIKYQLMNRLALIENNRWRNIEWECFSHSNEIDPISLDSIDEDGQESGNNRIINVSRKVVARIQAVSNNPTTLQTYNNQADHHSPLDLMVYIYFANYTITTTGYGDIIPTTQYIRFLCSFANICEVFFLVIFFNALLAFRKKGA